MSRPCGCPAALRPRAAGSPDKIHAIDTHAHVLTRGLPLAARRRYQPGYDALPANYTAVLAASRTSHGVIVQPSVLGTDNSFQVRSLAEARGGLRGIAVVEPAVDSGALDALAAAGVVGPRLNRFGLPVLDLGASPWKELLAAAENLTILSTTPGRFFHFYRAEAPA